MVLVVHRKGKDSTFQSTMLTKFFSDKIFSFFPFKSSVRTCAKSKKITRYLFANTDILGEEEEHWRQDRKSFNRSRNYPEEKAPIFGSSRFKNAL